MRTTIAERFTKILKGLPIYWIKLLAAKQPNERVNCEKWRMRLNARCRRKV